MRETKAVTCAVTGVRSKSIPYISEESGEKCMALKAALKTLMRYLIEREGVRCFLGGISPYVELYGCELALDLKSEYPDIKLKCVEAYEWQGMYYARSTTRLRRYERIKNQCDERIILQGPYSRGCEAKLRKYLTEQSDIILAIWDKLPSEPYEIVSYGQKKGKTIYRINPYTLEVSQTEAAN